MTYTEEEAKTKWCPMFRERNGYGACVASDCMMWRWAHKPNPDWKPDYGGMSSFQRDMRSDAPMYIDDTTRGYCGLAGRP